LQPHADDEQGGSVFRAALLPSEDTSNELQLTLRELIDRLTCHLK
jgi:hypothetical protein